MALTDKLRAIADSIRAKTGKTDGLTLDQMATEIAGIEGGGWNYATNEDFGVTIGDNTFRDNNHILDVDIPWCSEIGNSAFENATSLKTVKVKNLSDRYMYIEGAAFRNCTALEDITAIGVRDIGAANAGETFKNCSNLRSVNLVSSKSLGTNSQQVNIGPESFMNCGNLSEINGGSSLDCNTICSGAFVFCVSLTKIRLTDCAHIMKDAFYGCENLTAVILDGSVVCTVELSAFAETPIGVGEGNIYVPSAMYESYRTAYEAALDEIMPGFFSVLFRKIEDYPEICG